MNPLVSVIIPTYNRLAMLQEAIASVEAQSYPEIELVIADDGSADGTIDYIKHTNYIYLKLKHSGMPGHVRNMGAKAASGTFVAFLDSDDLWMPEKIAKQVDFFMKNPGLILCHTREIWDRQGQIISQAGQNHHRSGQIFADALVKCIIGPSTVMLKRNYFIAEGMFRDDMEIAEDYEFWLRLCAKYEIGYLEEPLVTKRAGHGDQLTEKYGHIEYFRIQALKQNIDDGIFEPEQQVLAAQELVRKLKIYAQGCMKRGKEQEGEECLKRADLYIHKFKR